MTNEVLDVLRQVQSRVNEFDTIALLSPSKEERQLFPNATVLGVNDWNLTHSRPDLRFDVIIASHVFHYSRDPALWFDNVLASCRTFLMADLVKRQRSHDSEYAPDGDYMRYAVGSHRPATEHVFDLNSLGERLLAHTVFDGGGNEFGEALHVLAQFRGKLDFPLVRMDDYPTGVRPILPDLQPIHDIITVFEERAIPVHLGIVPAILDENMVAFLQSLQHLKPVQHGYDHCYPKYSVILNAKNDPYNDRGTVRTLTEFKWEHYDAIIAKLRQGKELLEDRLKQTVDIYIPPNNKCTRSTARALRDLGFRLCLSEKTAPRRYLPTLKSGLYGRSPQLANRACPEVLTLHATWEWDVQRLGNVGALSSLADKIRDGTRTKLRMIDELAQRVSAHPSVEN